MLHEPHVRAFYELEVRKTLAGATLPAAGVLARLLDARSEKVSAEVALALLKIGGYVPRDATSMVVNNVVLPGYVVDLTAPQPVIEHQAIEPPAIELEPAAGDQ